jgi:TonB-linked SusC/RagA family outer membrane protein
MKERLTMFLVSLFLMVGTAMAQTKVNGTVTSQEDGQPVIGASVLVVGTQTGTVTDANGRFELTVPAGKKTLRITYVGMEPIEVSARPNMRIMLTSDQKALDEVIVVAYGTQKKSSFTGSASVVGADEIGKVQVTNAVDALKGKAAGVQIFSTSGQPGTTPTIRIRGVNSINAESDPLIVLDGAPYDGSLNDINPADVESMTVLKDAASTSLYGARGGNGVILVTTKTGKRGQEAKITFDAKWGSNQQATPNYNVISSPAKYYEMYYSGLNLYAQDKLGMNANEAWMWANQNMLSNSGDFTLGYNVYTTPEGQMMIGQNGKLNPNATLGRVVDYQGLQYLLTPDDWEKAVYHNGVRQEYTVSANGASDRGTFYLSANYLDNEGITTGSDFKRFTGRLKADYQLKEWLKVGANATYAHFTQNYLGDDGSSGSSGNAFSLINIAPIYPVYIRDANGNFIYDEKSRMNFYDYGDRKINGQYRPYLSQSNPISANSLDTREREGNTVNVTGTIEIRLPYGFTFTSINSAYMREYRYTNTTNPFFGQYASSNGIVQKEHLRWWNYNYQQRLNWRGTYGKHDIEAMVAHEYTRNRDYDLWGSKQNMFSVFNKELAGAVILGSTGSTMGDYNDERWVGRAQYSFDERYFLHTSITHEASSHFDPDHRWGTFWSLGGAWMISKEKFFNVKWIDELKLKASYGENGNDQIGSYRYINYYSINNSNNQVSLVPSSLGNVDISWEKAAKFNMGIDFSLLHNRIWGSIEYYRNKTNDMLSWYPLPASFGYTGYYANVGNMVNKGVEIDLHAEPLRMKDFSWTIYANLTSNNNKITELAEARKTWQDNLQGKGYSSGSYFYMEGESRYSYITRRYAGVYNESTFSGTGDEKYDATKGGMSMWWKNVYEKDANGNEIYYDTNWNKIENPDSYVGEKRRKKVGETMTTNYSESDDYIIGDMMPDVYGGFGTSVAWKGFDFSIDFQYQLGGKVYDSEYASLMGNTRGFGIHTDMLNSWTPTNTNTNIPRYQSQDTYTNGSSDRFIIGASYLSLQNITLGYTLPKSFTRKFFVDKIRIYAVADNIWVWSKRQGLDPRRSITGSSGAQYYSSIRTISGGVSVTF